ncbi:MAG: hypothetical protein KOO65_08610 [Desulfobacterales bacterium]|nr:hypothetical protein [Desulfobacterales bacterium]
MAFRILQRLSELVDDVNISSIADNDILRYNSATSKWLNIASDGTGAFGPWTRTGTTLSPTNAGDIIDVNEVTTGVINESTGIAVIDADSQFLDDTSGKSSIDWTDRQLLATDGTDVILDYSTAGTAAFGDTDLETTGDIDAGFMQVNQLAHSAGIQINGFDDRSTWWGKLSIDSLGYFNIDAATGWRFLEAGAPVAFIDEKTTNGFRMYDNIPLTFGATPATRYGFVRNNTSGDLDLKYNSGAWATFLSIDSAGDFDFQAGDITTTGDLTIGHTFNLGDATAATDSTINFLGLTNSGSIVWDEGSDEIEANCGALVAQKDLSINPGGIEGSGLLSQQAKVSADEIFTIHTMRLARGGGSGGVGLGFRWLMQLEESGGGVSQAANLEVSWLDPTVDDETSKWAFHTMLDGAVVEPMKFEGADATFAGDITTTGNGAFGTMNLSGDLYLDANDLTGVSDIIDDSAKNAFDVTNRELKDTGGTTVIDLDIEQLMTSGAAALDWSVGTMHSAGAEVLNWNTLLLKDSSAGNSINWDARQLLALGGTDVILDYSTAGTADFDDTDIETTGDFLTTGVSTVGGATDVVQSIVKGNASQTANLQTWTDSSDATLAQIQGNGRFYTSSGIRSEALEWGGSLIGFDSGGLDIIDDHTAHEADFDLTGGSFEALMTDLAGTFDSDDVGRWIIVRTGAKRGAMAAIAAVIDTDNVVLHTMGWDDDLADFGYYVITHPQIVMGDGYHSEFQCNSEGHFDVHSNDWVGSQYSNYMFEVELEAGADGVDGGFFEAKANGYNAVQAIVADYQSGDLQPGDTGGGMGIRVDVSEATSADATTEIDAYLAVTVNGSDANTTALRILPGFTNAVIVQGATAVDPSYGYDFVAVGGVTTDRVTGAPQAGTAFLDTSTTDMTIFGANGDKILIGNAIDFEVLEYTELGGGGKNIVATFEYSTGNDTWATLPILTDGTTGFQQSGQISWSAPGAWAASNASDGDAITSAKYIRITRTYAPTIVAPPVEAHFKIYLDRVLGMSIRGDATISPTTLADAAAPNFSIYYSSTQSKLVFKDGTVGLTDGTANPLY